MLLIDTHTHLFTKHFDDDLDEVMQRAKEAGVGLMLLPDIDAESTPRMKAVCKRFPDMVKPMMGIHPCHVTADYENQLSIVKSELEQGGYIAVGEIGLDLHWDKESLPFQIIAFEQQMEWAKELKLPVAVHCRTAYDEVIASITKVQDGNLTGVLHCFTGNLDQANALLDLGFYLGIGGVVTFKNSGVAETVAELPMDRLVLETDSPYLAPKPFRGKRNESSYVKFVAEKLAEVKGLPVEEIADITTKNAIKLFKLELTNAQQATLNA
ncbi:MAG: TatD DNase family protein [Bacteroidia bacterium]|jgi:TatD DNase family protein